MLLNLWMTLGLMDPLKQVYTTSTKLYASLIVYSLSGRIELDSIIPGKRGLDVVVTMHITETTEVAWKHKTLCIAY